MSTGLLQDHRTKSGADMAKTKPNIILQEIYGTMTRITFRMGSGKQANSQRLLKIIVLFPDTVRLTLAPPARAGEPYHCGASPKRSEWEGRCALLAVKRLF